MDAFREILIYLVFIASDNILIAAIFSVILHNWWKTGKETDPSPIWVYKRTGTRTHSISQREVYKHYHGADS
jgi:hypothetical protein